MHYGRICGGGGGSKNVCGEGPRVFHPPSLLPDLSVSDHDRGKEDTEYLGFAQGQGEREHNICTLPLKISAIWGCFAKEFSVISQNLT